MVLLLFLDRCFPEYQLVVHQQFFLPAYDICLCISFFFGKIIYSASAFAVAMDQWTGVHRAFIIRAYYRNNDSISTAQRMFKKQFSIYQVPPCNVIKSWLRHFECTGSSQAGGCASRSSIPVSERNAFIIIIILSLNTLFF